MMAIKTEITGDLAGVKKEIARELEGFYQVAVDRGMLVSRELAQSMAMATGLLGREVAVYINRRGRVVAVAVGDHAKVSLPEFQGRRKENRLAGVRCIHTHPGESGELSGVDWAALSTLQLDCMAAIGVKDGMVANIYAGFLAPRGMAAIGNGTTGVHAADRYYVKGPLDLADLDHFDFLKVVAEIERELRSAAVIRPVVVEEERAVLVGLELPAGKNQELPAEESLQELAQLVETAGAKVVGSYLQKKGRIDATYFIGRGLAEQLSLRVQELEANLLVVDHELNGVQARNLEQVIGVRVLDRTAVILDIFAQRAQTREGKLQVELAQLKYRLPRLVGLGGALSRLAGGIGTRGPGETKLESDRRHIRRRINEIEEQLAEVQKRRKVQRAGRVQVPTVVLVGYTNAGKSTLRYRLLQVAASQQTHWEQEDPGRDAVFATLDPTLRGIILPDGREVLLADTVGFIHKLPHQFVSAFRATLEEVLEADLLLHVVDASSPRWEDQMQTVEQVLAELGVMDKPCLVVFNKADLLEAGAIRLPPIGGTPHVTVSATQGTGFDVLLQEMARLLQNETREVRLAVPYGEAGLVAELYQSIRVVAVSYGEEAILVEAVMRPEQVARYQNYLIDREGNPGSLT